MSDDNRPVKVFYCKDDVHGKHVWETAEYILEDGVDCAPCPYCGAMCEEQSYHFLNLRKAWMNQTGPRTAAGKRRSSLNGWKTGEHSKKLRAVAPALPGKFAMCDGCEYREPCENEPYSYCPVNVQPMMQIIAAYENGDTAILKELAGVQHARLTMIVEMMYKSLIENGVLLPTKEQKREGKDGVETLILDYQRNPLLETLPKYIELMGLTAKQQMMTPENQEISEQMTGYLQVENERAINLQDHLEKQRDAMAGLKMHLRKAALSRDSDPALQAFRKEKDTGGAIEAEFTVEDD